LNGFKPLYNDSLAQPQVHARIAFGSSAMSQAHMTDCQTVTDWMAPHSPLIVKSDTTVRIPQRHTTTGSETWLYMVNTQALDAKHMWAGMAKKLRPFKTDMHTTTYLQGVWLAENKRPLRHQHKRTSPCVAQLISRTAEGSLPIAW
jgi:hypothetical protein